MNTISQICINLNINRVFSQVAPPPPQNIEVNKCTTWNALIYPTKNIHTLNNNIPPLPNYTNEIPIKFPPQYCYYTDGSFIPPMKVGDSYTRELAGYGIYNEAKDIKLAIRLPGLQNIFIAELMAIHHTLKLITEGELQNEPAHIFTDCLNGLYVIKNQMKHPTLHNNHPDKTILEEIVTLLTQRTQSTTIYKVKAHANLKGNEVVDALAKEGTRKATRPALLPHEHAHATPYYFGIR